MHKRLYRFLNENIIISLFQFGFRQKYFNSFFELIHITETIKVALEQEKKLNHKTT